MREETERYYKRLTDRDQSRLYTLVFSEHEELIYLIDDYMMAIPKELHFDDIWDRHKYVLRQIINDRTEAEATFLGYCIERFPSEARELKNLKADILFRSFSSLLDEYDPKNFHYDREEGERVDKSGRIEEEVLEELQNTLFELHYTIREKKPMLKASLASEIRSYMLQHIPSSSDMEIRTTMIEILADLVHTKKQALSVAEYLEALDDSHGNWKRIRLLEAYADPLVTLEAKKKQASSSYAKEEIIKEYLKRGYDEEAVKYAREELDSFTEERDGRVVQIVYDSFMEKGDTKGLFKYYLKCHPPLLFHRLVLEEARKEGNVKVQCKALSAIMQKEGKETEEAAEAYKSLKQLDPLLAEKTFKNLRNIRTRLRIWADEGMWEEILKIVMTKGKGYSYYYLEEEEYDHYAKVLEDIYPKEICDYYWERAWFWCRPGKGDKDYELTAMYLLDAKSLDQRKGLGTWEEKFASFYDEMKSRRTMVRELYKVCLLGEDEDE